MTNMTCISNDEPLLSGTERFDVMGDLLSPNKCEEIIMRCKGLTRHWNCLEKAKIAQRVLHDGVVVVGSCELWSRDMKSKYGHLFNPPFEFHAWLQLPQGIIDIALPGVIEKGLTTSDHIGPFLSERIPFILARKPFEWMEYKPIEIIG